MSRLTKKEADGNYTLVIPENVSDMEIRWATYDKLGKYEDLEDEGRLFIEPCKIGTKLYMVAYHDFGKPGINEYTVVSFHADESGIWLIDLEIELNGRVYTRNIETDDIGKTAFLTTEEADKALEKKIEELKGLKSEL